MKNPLNSPHITFQFLKQIISRFRDSFSSVINTPIKHAFSANHSARYIWNLSVRACLHGGGGPQVGEVTRLGEVKK